MITQEENQKIRNLMAVIEAMEGVNIPYPTARKISDVYKELQEFAGREEVR